ncbi:MAG: hypothetical protein QXQ76_00280 [Candidatus Bathyarchaeia archaeon]
MSSTEYPPKPWWLVPKEGWKRAWYLLLFIYYIIPLWPDVPFFVWQKYIPGPYGIPIFVWTYAIYQIIGLILLAAFIAYARKRGMFSEGVDE